MKKNSFDNVALFYDRLARLIYSSSITNSQLVYLNRIPHNGKVLIIGGGTGWILKEIFKLKPEVHITYIELSEKMLQLSERYVLESKANQVTFILGDETKLKSFKGSEFDVIITNFFLDVFIEKRLNIIMNDLNHLLKDNGLWINTDFIVSNDTGLNVLKKVLIKCMYIFFRVVCNLEGSKLLNFKAKFGNLNLNHVDNHTFFYNMIHADLYVKPSLD